jgi:hypothetical protein
MCSPRLLAAATAVLLLPAAASAQASLWDLFHPERLVTRLLQFGVTALRSQVDLTYGGIDVNLLTGTIAITDIRAWPRNPWDPDGTCQVDIDRLTLRTAAVDEDDIARIKVQVTGASAPASCLPPDAQGGIAMLGLDRLALGRLTVDVDYRISSASLNAHLHARADDLAAVSLLADFDYLAFEQKDGATEPMPVAYLREARLTVEDLGAWGKMQGLVPPPMNDPAQGGPALGEMLAGMMPPSGPAGDALIASAQEAWAAFLADPRRLVLETGFDPGAPVFLDPARIEQGGPEALLTALQPRVAVRPAATLAMVPVSLLQATPEQLSDADRLTVGLALASGQGAPRDLTAARVLLTPLAEAGNGEAAAALARALESRAPAEAYGYALLAASAGAPATGALLDRIESGLPFATVLAEQEKKVGGEHSADALDSLLSIRAEAAARLTGRGQTRSYATAALWAMLGAAAGDAESADILDDIDQRVRLAGPEALAAWEPLETEAATLARDAWIGFDLPATLGGN